MLNYSVNKNQRGGTGSLAPILGMLGLQVNQKKSLVGLPKSMVFSKNASPLEILSASTVKVWMENPR